MSEFLDFLKHKYAYVAIGKFKPGKFVEAQKLYEKAVSTYTKGFQGAYLLGVCLATEKFWSLSDF